MIYAALALLFAGLATPASAEFFGCNDRPGRVLSSYTSGSSARTSSRTTHELAAQTSRPRIMIYPRERAVGRNSVRQCRSQLVKEYRVSGTVIVPKMQCWWE
ncbi:MAG: hypothetical protein WDN48_07070 [Pseudolabrys sp.]